MYQNFLVKIYICQYGVTYEIEDKGADTIYKLNTVSETINEMSKTYKEEGTSPTLEKETKKAFEETLIDKLDRIKENILYEELINEENGLLSDVFELLQEKRIYYKRRYYRTFRKKK